MTTGAAASGGGPAVVGAEGPVARLLWPVGELLGAAGGVKWPAAALVGPVAGGERPAAGLLEPGVAAMPGAPRAATTLPGSRVPAVTTRGPMGKVETSSSVLKKSSVLGS